MYCLQWLLPVLLIPKHWLHPQFILNQALFMWFYIIGFFVERRYVPFELFWVPTRLRLPWLR